MVGSELCNKIVQLGIADVDSVMKLSSAVGWNQIDCDWQHFLTKGETIGIHDTENNLIASAAVLPYDGEFGFISMVLVKPAWRRRGIASQMLAHCLNLLKKYNRIPVLDATEAGEKIYRKIGFQTQFRFDRWQRISDDTLAVSSSTSTVDIDEINSLDANALGSGRESLLQDFLRRPDTRCTILSDLSGFGLLRRGRLAFQLGPIVASSDELAVDIFTTLLSFVHGSVFIDVPVICQRLGEELQNKGFTKQRSFARMALARSEPFGQPAKLFAIAGPEFG